MATYQTTYGDAPAKGLPGQIANEEKSNRISRTVETVAGIPFGAPAYRGAGDHGVVAGAAFAATSVGAAVAGNTGAATITAAPPVVAGALQGVYKLTAVSAGATAIFLMTDPDGIDIGEATTGTPATIGGIGPFTITDAGTDPAVGDQFTITVTYTANARFIGLAILNPAVPPAASGATVDAYPRYFTGAFLTMGQMYVTAGGVVNDGDQAYWNPATGRYTTTTTHIRIPSLYFDTTGVDGDIVEVSLRSRAAS
jgi:hypothetical protein